MTQETRALAETQDRIDAGDLPDGRREGFQVSYTLSKGRRLSCVFFGLVYALITLLSFSDFSPAGAWGWLALPILGYGSFHFLRVGFDSRPRFEFTSDGFVDRTFPGGGDLHLRWDDIRDLRWTTFGGQLEIHVRDPGKVRRNAGWPRKFWMFLGALYRKKTISIIPTSSTSGPNLVELRARIEARLLEHERTQLGLPPVGEVGTGAEWP